MCSSRKGATGTSSSSGAQLFSLSSWIWAQPSEVKLRGQLDLSRIEHCARRPIQGIGRPFLKELPRASTTKRTGVNRTKVRRAVDRIEESYIGGIKDVK